MALTSYELHVIASTNDGCPLPDSLFLGRLVGLQDLGPAEISPSRSRYQTARVTVRQLATPAVGGDLVELEHRLELDLQLVATWLLKQPPEAFSALRGLGAKAALLLDICIDQDQFEVVLPPSLLSVCGRLDLPVHLITND